MSRYGLGQQAMEQGISEMAVKIHENTYRSCFSGIMLALTEQMGFPKEKLPELAVRTMRYINNSLSAEELREELKEKTGFDIDAELADDYAEV